MFGREPTLILAAVRAVLVCAVAFGLELTDTQFVALYAVVETIVALWNRSQVTPVDKSSGSHRI